MYKEPKGHAGSVECVTIGGDKIVSGSLDRTLRIWNINSGECKVLTGHAGSVLCVTIAGDKIVSGSSDNTLRIWNINSGECKVLIGHGPCLECNNSRR